MTTYIAIQLTTSGKALLISARQSRTFCIHFNSIAPKGTTMGIAFKLQQLVPTRRRNTEGNGDVSYCFNVYLAMEFNQHFI